MIIKSAPCCADAKDKTLKPMHGRYRYIIAAIPVVIVLGIWEYFACAIDNAALLPTIEAVAGRLAHPFRDILQTGSLANHAFISIVRVVTGFFIGAILGVVLGLATGQIRIIRILLEPVVEIVRPICPIVWVPFALITFRLETVESILGFRYAGTVFGEVFLAMLFVISYGAFFPVFINTLFGVQSIRTIYLDSAAVLGSTGWNAFFRVVVPAAAPDICTGLRVGFGTAWFVIIAAEMLPGSSSGLGYMIMYAYQMTEMDILMAGMICIGITGSGMGALITWLTGRVSFWQSREH